MSMRSSTSAISIRRSTIRSVWRTLCVVGRIDPSEHGALEFAAEAVHVDFIPQPAAHHAAFTPPADLFEASPLVSLDARRIEREDRQHNVVEAEGRKGVVEHQARRLCTVALAAAFEFADKDAEGSRAVAVVYTVQSGVADRPQRLPFVDRKRHVVFRLRLPVVPFLLLLARHGKRGDSQRAHRAQVVDPTLVERQEITPQRTKRHEVSLDVSYWTF